MEIIHLRTWVRIKKLQMNTSCLEWNCMFNIFNINKKTNKKATDQI